MSQLLRMVVALAMVIFAPAVLGDDLSVDRLVGSPSLNGPSVAGLKLSPDGTRVTYPGKRHRITGEDEQAHLWQSLIDFFDANL